MGLRNLPLACNEGYVAAKLHRLMVLNLCSNYFAEIWSSKELVNSNYPCSQIRSGVRPLLAEVRTEHVKAAKNDHWYMTIQHWVTKVQYWPILQSQPKSSVPAVARPTQSQLTGLHGQMS